VSLNDLGHLDVWFFLCQLNVERVVLGQKRIFDKEKEQLLLKIREHEKTIRELRAEKDEAEKKLALQEVRILPVHLVAAGSWDNVKTEPPCS
jgi:hypothetical protein